MRVWRKRPAESVHPTRRRLLAALAIAPVAGLAATGSVRLGQAAAHAMLAVECPDAPQVV